MDFAAPETAPAAISERTLPVPWALRERPGLTVCEEEETAAGSSARLWAAPVADFFTEDLPWPDFSGCDFDSAFKYNMAIVVP